MNDVSQKFYGDPDNATDLSELDFYARKAVIEEVAEWCDENENTKPQIIVENRWTPILYRYEVKCSLSVAFVLMVCDLDSEIVWQTLGKCAVTTSELLIDCRKCDHYSVTGAI